MGSGSEPKQSCGTNGDSVAENRTIERTSIEPDVAIPARYPHEVTIHQVRIEHTLKDDLRRYSSRGVERSTRLIMVSIDEKVLQSTRSQQESRVPQA